MATQASAIFRYRTGGNAANGAGFDAAISGATTDYSQQDAAQLSLTDIACSNTTTVTSAAGGFTAAMIGNAIRITGGGATTGYYWITARASTNSITVDRAPGTVAAGSGKVGGACAGDLATVGTQTVPGNLVYVRATAGNAASYPTASLDYTIAGFFTAGDGSATVGYVRWIGENGVPTIGQSGLGFFGAAYHSLEGLYFVATGSGAGNFGIVNCGSSPFRMLGCTVNMNNQAGTTGIKAGCLELVGCEVYGGTASPTASTDGIGVSLTNNRSTVVGNVIRKCRDAGLVDAGLGNLIAGNKIYGCVGDGVKLTSTTPIYLATVTGNTIDGNGGHGINVSGTAGIAAYEIRNNCVTNQAGVGKYGINVADGTTAVNDRRKAYCDYNNLYNNTGSYNAISAGAHDLAIDPTYTSASTGDFTPTNALLQAGL